MTEAFDFASFYLFYLEFYFHYSYLFPCILVFLCYFLIMKPDTLASVLRNHGSFGPVELGVLAKDYPNLVIAAKMGCSPRFTCPAKEMARRVEVCVFNNASDYVREFFIPCQTYDVLCAMLGFPKDY